MPTADDIDALLPQTQCTRCGYPACRPYAQAIADGEAQINQCPPGGEAVIEALAELLHREAQPLNPANGVQMPLRVAVIDEQRCIGCAKCLPACPVDAIVGAQKYMHTVVTALCTGCDLCLPPCPVDCIQMVPLTVAQPAQSESLQAIQQRAVVHRQRYHAHTARREKEQEARQAQLAAKKRLAQSLSTHEAGPAR
jgi:Na+-translocating ferredoxin:NAD+ oxidoreductase subunit B